MLDIYEQHLLVIDDEVDITKSLFRQFRRKYKVHTATSGHEALELMERYPIQVVLSDQRMPGMTGVDFFTAIKDKYPDALKMILTGYADIEAVVGAINEGQVFRYITKPWNPTELDASIGEAFEKHELITSNRKLLGRLKAVNESLEEKVKARTKELEMANDRLKLLNIEKNKYVGIVAHDLRNPIGNVYSFSDLLLSDLHAFSDDEQIKYLKVINERSAYSLKLIESFLDTSKIESGILDLDFKAWDFNELILGCIAQNKMFARKKEQQIQFIPNAALPPILCDKDKIEQVINNLLSNAIKYSAEGTQIDICSTVDDDALLTQVKDQGRGIRSDELHSIFDVYQTTSTASTAGEKSTGLGLAIVKKIVESHRGRITAESIVGQGSVFSFTLPLTKA